MKMDKVAGSGKDEFYTPRYAIFPILKYIKPRSRIWCPFDTEQSLFVKVFREHGHAVKHTHLCEGHDGDFFNVYKDGCEYIISNPPYSIKAEVFERLFKLKIPFAMLVGVVGLFESQRRFKMFQNNVFEILYMNKRISYFENYKDQKPALNPPFSSVYITSNMLPEKIMFEEVDKRVV